MDMYGQVFIFVVIRAVCFLRKLDEKERESSVGA